MPSNRRGKLHRCEQNMQGPRSWMRADAGRSVIILRCDRDQILRRTIDAPASKACGPKSLNLASAQLVLCRILIAEQRHPVSQQVRNNLQALSQRRKDGSGRSFPL